MDVPLVEQAIVNTKLVYMGLNVLQSDNGRLFHHVAEVARKCQFRPTTFAQRGFDEQNFAANACPSQARNHAGIVVALIDVAVIRRFAQQSLYLGRRYFGKRQLAVKCPQVGHLAQSLVYLLFKLPHTTLAGVLLNNLFKSRFVEVGFLCGVFSQARVLQFARHKVAFGNFYLLFGDVTAHLDKFHTVEQWARNGVEVVGGGDEKHTREIEINIEIVVVEGVILLGVEHFEQRRRGVAVQSVLRYLVYLVENEHRIGRTCFLYALDDTARHGANVGSAVSANFRFVVQSAQRHAHILTVHGRGDALSKTGFTHSGRSVKANDGRF